MTLKEMREKSGELAKTIKAIADKANNENRDFTPEEKGNWEKVNNDYNSLAARIKIAERAEEVEAASRAIVTPVLPGREDTHQQSQEAEERSQNPGKPAPTEEQRALCLQAWMREQVGEPLEERHEDACEALKFNPRRRTLDIRLGTTDEYRKMQETGLSVHRSQMQRALSGVTIAAGAATIPEGFVRNLEVAALAYGDILGTSEVIRTEGGEDMPWPTANDTGNQARQVGENTTVLSVNANKATTSKDPTFAQLVMHAYKWTTDIVLVPTELMEDSAFDLSNFISTAFGVRIGRGWAAAFTTGTGAAQPAGIVPFSTLGTTTASATAITTDELITLEHSVDPAYRNNPGVGYMMHDGLISYLRKLKDGIGRYLWSSGLADGRPDTLNGRRVYINQAMTSTTSGAPVTATRHILFGDLKAYKIRQVRGIRMYRMQERYRDSDQDGFVAFVRADGGLLDAGTHPIRHLLQA